MLRATRRETRAGTPDASLGEGLAAAMGAPCRGTVVCGRLVDALPGGLVEEGRRRVGRGEDPRSRRRRPGDERAVAGEARAMREVADVVAPVPGATPEESQHGRRQL